MLAIFDDVLAPGTHFHAFTDTVQPLRATTNNAPIIMTTLIQVLWWFAGSENQAVLGYSEAFGQHHRTHWCPVVPLRKHFLPRNKATSAPTVLCVIVVCQVVTMLAIFDDVLAPGTPFYAVPDTLHPFAP